MQCWNFKYIDMAVRFVCNDWKERKRERESKYVCGDILNWCKRSNRSVFYLGRYYDSICIPEYLNTIYSNTTLVGCKGRTGR